MVMKTALILDTETSGTGPDRDHVIEIACVLYSIESATPIGSYASLLRAETNEAEAINRIPASALKDAPEPAKVWSFVGAMIDKSDAIIAHNAEFDRSFLPASLRDRKQWICTMDDLQWPMVTKPGGSLVNLALDHELGVASAHRAMTDCDLIARLLTRVAKMGVDLQTFLARGLRPKAKYQALVSFDEKDAAKELGFKWVPETKQWVKTIAIEDAESLPFEVRMVA